jgi:hypothetical protein
MYYRYEGTDFSELARLALSLSLVNVGERADWVQEVNGVQYSAGDIADRQLHDFLLKNAPKSGLSILSRNLGGVEEGGRGVDSLPGFPPATCPNVQVSGVEEEVLTEDLANYFDGVEEESQKSQKSKIPKKSMF